MALGLSGPTPKVQLSVYTVSACWHAELGLHMPSKYLALAGAPVHYHCYNLRTWQAVQTLDLAHERHSKRESCFT